MIKKLKKNLRWEDPGSNQYHGNMGEAESNSNSCSFIFAGHLSFLLLAWPRKDCKFSSRNMSHRQLRGNKKVKGLLISSHLNLKRPRKWRISSEFWAPSNWPALKRTCLLLVHMLETTSQLFLIPPLFTCRDSLNAQPDHSFSDVFLSLPFKGRAFSLFYYCFQSGSLHCYILTVRLRTITIQKQQYK